MKSKYHTKSHCKYLLKYHLIFVVKYRHKLLTVVGEDVKKIFKQISEDYQFHIDVMEVDKDHIHLLIELSPNQKPSEIASKLKSISTIWLWKNRGQIIVKKLWGTKKFWSSGYFICTTGDACTATIQEYIKNQG
jgi:putative transposase